jgi:hypothetical protein
MKAAQASGTESYPTCGGSERGSEHNLEILGATKRLGGLKPGGD